MQNIAEPPVDIIEKADKFIIIMDLPGVKPENLSIKATENSITVSGIKINEFTGRYIRMERFVGKVKRTIHFNTYINITNTVGTLKDGVLILEIPKATNEFIVENCIEIIIRR